MIREAIGALHWSYLPVISMFMFLSIFLGSLIWVFRKGSKEVYSELSQLPLAEEGVHHE